MTQQESVRLLIVGGGPAAYTAALYGARSGLAPVCLEGYDAGGQISRTSTVDNFPAAPNGITGADLAARIRTQASAFGARVLAEVVTSVDLSKRPFLVTATDHSFRADALIIATGSRPRPLGLPGEEELIGRGIAYCALCDGAFYSGLDVVVVGGGNAALDETMAMARVASRVTLVHRNAAFRADPPAVQAARRISNIDFMTPYTVEDLVTGGDGSLCGLKLHNLDTSELTYRATSGLFVAIGHEPSVELFAPFVGIRSGHISTNSTNTATTREGVFAAGDVVDSRYRQAVTAAASGCMAAIDAGRWLATGEWAGADSAASTPVLTASK